ncbi:MAG: phosphoglycerate dehydrogenase [Opitutaceae bacterium]|nr:phosphoglycerate dehydrogenase [Opitutaceae bacterium]
MTRVLLSTTSFQDTPGDHHQLLAEAGFDLVRERGPLPESQMLELADQFDAFLCGDDAFTRRVLEKAKSRVRVISKYGVGLDKIDLVAATDLRIPVLFTPGVNHQSVAEHTFALMLATYRNLVVEANHVAAGNWKRITGRELFGKTLFLIGLGRIGREVAIRARGFSLRVIAFGNYWDADFAAQHGVERVATIEDGLRKADIVSLHTGLTEKTRHLLDARRLALLRQGALIVNCARGELIELQALVGEVRSNRLSYAADVLDEEPPARDHPLLDAPNVILTPHIGSRTHESVGRQARASVENLTRFLQGKEPLARANPF